MSHLVPEGVPKLIAVADRATRGDIAAAEQLRLWGEALVLVGGVAGLTALQGPLHDHAVDKGRLGSRSDAIGASGSTSQRGRHGEGHRGASMSHNDEPRFDASQDEAAIRTRNAQSKAAQADARRLALAQERDRARFAASPSSSPVPTTAKRWPSTGSSGGPSTLRSATTGSRASRPCVGASPYKLVPDGERRVPRAGRDHGVGPEGARGRLNGPRA